MRLIEEVDLSVREVVLIWRRSERYGGEREWMALKVWSRILKKFTEGGGRESGGRFGRKVELGVVRVTMEVDLLLSCYFLVSFVLSSLVIVCQCFGFGFSPVCFLSISGSATLFVF